MKDFNGTLSPVRLDLDGFHRNLRREGTPTRVFYFEHGVADAMQLVLHEHFGIWDHVKMNSPAAAWDRTIATHRFLGHEYFRVFPPGARVVAPRQAGDWTHENVSVITTFQDFERYPWPRPEDTDYAVLDYMEKSLSRDMRVFHVVDLWEVVRDLMGFETICFALYEQPHLVEALFEKVGSFLEQVLNCCLDYECYGAVYLSDDLGYKTSLMISPEQIHRFILPWHQRLADLAHRHDKFFFFHSCGQIYGLIDYYLDCVRIDAKHSFEENVMPVEEVKRRYGQRMTLLGGIDVDLLARSDPPTIRKKTRQVLDVCQPDGGYFLGAGNWVTNYVPFDNYIAMLDEGRRYKRE